MNLDAGKLGPRTLEGEHVRLEPLRKRHGQALFEAGRRLDWAWFLGPLKTRKSVERRIADGIRAERRDLEYAFAVVVKKERRIVGSTAYLSTSSKHRRTEIGSTWYAPEFWGTVVNPECKFLLLRHAFEDWGAVRVQLGTDENNIHSQRAILKLGAKLEGRLRNHGIRPDGSVRDTMLYSIIDKDWPVIRSRLLRRIESLGGWTPQVRSRRIRISWSNADHDGFGQPYREGPTKAD